MSNRHHDAPAPACSDGQHGQVQPIERPRPERTLILGVAASDAHVVANHLIAHHLRLHGFKVVNLGPCTPIASFCRAYDLNPTAEAVLIGSLNGHAYEDLRELRAARRRGLLKVPVIIGGNLSVGSCKRASDHERLFGLGVDSILGEITEIVPLLDHRPAVLAHAV